MNKQTLFVSLTTAVMLCACQSSKVKISGRFVGNDAKDVYLEQVLPLTQSVIDSAVLDKDGNYRFELKGVAKTPSLYNIIYNGERIPLFLAGGEKLSLNSVGSVVRNYTVEGSKESELLRQFYQAFVSGAQRLDNIASQFAKATLASGDSFKKVVVFEIPKGRAYMHLDTVFTQVDHDKFTVHPGILGALSVYELTGKGEKTLKTRKLEAPLEDILKHYLHLDSVQLIRCGGESPIAAAREQWSDGSNTLCIRPGVVLVYDRNYVTNRILNDCGIETLEMPSSELSRGRGGPRCMSMPLVREEP